MAAPAIPATSESDYLTLERTSEGRHELIDGVVMAMTGASKRHNRTTQNLASALRAKSSSRGCETYTETVRLRITETTHLYPDVMVVCDDNNDDDYAVTSPCLIAEVLSPSTSWVDHGRKRIAYLQIPSLRDYLLLNTVDSVVEHFTRPSADVSFTYHVHSTGDSLTLHCLPETFTVNQLFAQTVPPSPT